MKKYSKDELEQLRDQLKAVPLDTSTNGEEVLDEDWHVFSAGTGLATVLNWFRDLLDPEKRK